MTVLPSIAFGFGTCLVLALAGIALAPHLGLLDIPTGRKQHLRPVARVGGLALILSLAVRTALGNYSLPLTRFEGGAVLAMAIIGLVDDRFDIPARWKAGLGLLIAAGLALVTAQHIPLPNQNFELFWFTVPPTYLVVSFLLFLVFWGLPHAFNLIDGANGLSMGYGLIVLGAFWAVGFRHPFFMGAMLACFLLNWPRARLFLGDCGSLSIGLLLVILAKSNIAPLGPNHILWLFAYPTIDVFMVILIRLLKGKNIATADRNHFHFQIQDRWPRLAPICAPLLWLPSGMCASELFLTGAWRVIPWLGLGLLLGQAAFFILAAVLARKSVTGHVPMARTVPQFSDGSR